MEVAILYKVVMKTLVVRRHSSKLLKKVREEAETISISNSKNRKGKIHKVGAHLVCLRTLRRQMKFEQRS